MAFEFLRIEASADGVFYVASRAAAAGRLQAASEPERSSCSSTRATPII